MKEIIFIYLFFGFDFYGYFYVWVYVFNMKIKMKDFILILMECRVCVFVLLRFVLLSCEDLCLVKSLLKLDRCVNKCVLCV